MALVNRVDLWTLESLDFPVFQYLQQDQTVREGLIGQRDLVILYLLLGLMDPRVLQVLRVLLDR
jgi:hypothetical protein